MPPDNGSAQEATWPLPKFMFEVDLSPELKSIPFQEVSGLEIETQIIEYRHGNSPVFSNIKMPGIAKYGNVTLKKGVFVNDNKLFDWYTNIKMNTIKRNTVTIKLLDEKGNPVMQWQLANAWPTKISSTDMKAAGNEVAVESIEIAHEQLTVKTF
jgi:phage tail-like protein